jgi:predicted TIM-barrel fold metal-dependent hydrolase
MELIYESGVGAFRGQWDTLLPDMAVKHPTIGSGDWESPYLVLGGEDAILSSLMRRDGRGEASLEPGILQDKPRARLREMNGRGDLIHLISAGPSIGAAQHLPSNLAAGVFASFNYYAIGYCAPDPTRLKTVVQVHGLEPEWSAAEIRAMAKEECVAAVSICLPVRSTPDDARFSLIWQALEDTGLPFLHRPSFSGANWTPRHLLAYLTQAGILDRYPSLRVALMEVGLSWVAGWVEHLAGLLSASGQQGRAPRQYVEDGRILAAVGPDDTVADVEAAAREFGEGALVWESRFPIDSDPARGVVAADDRWRRVLARNGERLLSAHKPAY